MESDNYPFHSNLRILILIFSIFVEDKEYPNVANEIFHTGHIFLVGSKKKYIIDYWVLDEKYIFRTW